MLLTTTSNWLRRTAGGGVSFGIRDPLGRGDLAAFAALVVTGVALRVWLWASPLAPVDGDEAVVGLMARKILDGEFQAFFWGQEYGGIHEALLVALLLAVRVPHGIAMEVVPVVLHAAGAV